MGVLVARRAVPGHDARREALWWSLAAALLGVALGATAGVAGPVAALGFVLLPAVVWLFLRPDWLPVVLTATVFAEAITVGDVTISRLAGPLALAVLLVQVRQAAAIRLPEAQLPLALVLYALWALASALWTVNVDASFHAGGTAFALSSLVLSAIYLVAVVVLVRSERDVRRVVWTVWAMSMLMGAVAIVEYLVGSGRSQGVSGDANFFASLQVVAIPIGAALAASLQRGAARGIVLTGVAISVGSVFTSLSRGGILALAAVVVLLAAQPARGFFRTAARKRAFLAFAVVGGGILLAASYSALSARTSSLFHTAEGGSGRENLWRAAVTGWHDAPVHGIGFGAFQSRSNDLLRQTPGVDFSAYRLRPDGQPVHNAYLESLVELGLVGLGLFLGLLAATARSLRRSAQRAGSPFVASIARALLVALAGFAFTSLFLSTETDRTLWLLMGLTIALSRLAAQRPPTPSTP